MLDENHTMPEVNQDQDLSVDLVPGGVPFVIVWNMMGTDNRIFLVVYRNLFFDRARWDLGKVTLNFLPPCIAFENNVACSHS